MSGYVVEFADVQEAADRLSGMALRTPVLTSPVLDEAAGCSLFLKCEHMQRVGAFKFRGAWNAISALSEEEAARGVCTHSSGNHAQAVALAAKERGIQAWVVMPENAAAIKREAVLGHGAEVIMCESTLAAREATVAEVIERTAAVMVHPYDNPQVIAGQATAAMELIDEVGHLDAIVAPVGGGGLLAGSCISGRALLPDVRMFAAEPEGADDAARSLAAGHIIPQTGPDTICDGLLTSLGELTWPILRDHLETVITVSDEEVIAAMHLLNESTGNIAEPSGAVSLAAVLNERFKELADIERVGVIISGGNIAAEDLPF